MTKYLGGTTIAHPSENSQSWIPRNRDSGMPGIISGTGSNTVFLVINWINANGEGQGSRWLTHELGHIWDTNTGIVLPGGVHWGVADQLNTRMGGTIASNPFACRYCDQSGPGKGNNYPFVPGSYGNNSTADYLAETFALSIYPNMKDPVPAPAQSWVQFTIIYETLDLLVPKGFQY